MTGVSRRQALKILAAAGAAATTGCEAAAPRPRAGSKKPTSAATVDPILGTASLGFQWETSDPFLFCVHHDDHYPKGNDQLGPATSLAGRNLGSDFELREGFRMYHGRVVPGFPRHPHRGFETVTVVRRGLLDHSDSMGAAARYGGGDVQWLTAGGGIQHAEMFPLLRSDRDNPLELFQIWLNLPRANKMVEPHFSMLWQNTIPSRVDKDERGRATKVTVMAGRYGSTRAPSPPPNSWAAPADNDVGIWTIKMDPGARWTLPATKPTTNRSLYFFHGPSMRVAGQEIPASHQVKLRADLDVPIESGPGEIEMLLLQGRPIGQPIARHGPFVMNTQDEIRQAYADFRSTEFGGWPWRGNDPVHGREEARFAKHADGRVEKPA